MKIKKISKKNRDVMYELIVPSLGQKKRKKRVLWICTTVGNSSTKLEDTLNVV